MIGHDDRAGERGVILPSVLILLAFAATVVMLMVSMQEIAIQRSRRFNEAAQANAYARGGELSVITALRRDGIEAPDSDNANEGWARIAQQTTAIENGTFSLFVRDAQGRFNVNNLVEPDAINEQSLQAIVATSRLPPSVATRITAFIKARGAIGSLDELSRSGLSPQDIARLDAVVVALPRKTTVNINAAGVELLAALLGNPVAARRLVNQRTKRGLVTTEDVTAARVILPASLGYTSDFFEVEATVTIGDTAQTIRTLLQRFQQDNVVVVQPIRRTHSKTAPLPAPH